MRDLTANNTSREQTPVNPFEEEELNSSVEFQGGASYQNSSDDNVAPEMLQSDHYGKPFNAYNGFYSSNGNGTSSHLLSEPDSPSADDSHRQSTQNLNVPPEYDRYPSMAGSRVVSTSSLQNLVQQNRNSNRAGTDSPYQERLMDDGSSGSGRSGSINPFMLGTDFSPFGGYPALSFPLHVDEKEPDDYLHNPDPIADAEYDKNRFLYDLKNLDKRSLGGLIGIIVLLLGAIGVFILLPVFLYSGAGTVAKPEVYEVLSLYNYPILSAVRSSLVDPDTPDEAKTIKSYNGETWDLVFLDEFNAEGRTFYEGDDQFFTAVDLHYDATKDLEWYDPDAALTANGTLNLRMDAFKNHNLFYRSGMMQTWNKFCFTQGHIEVSARLPNYGSISGLWPGLWTMGNLGRPGYLASTEGVWPYSYDSCDAGITPNQLSPDGISYLPGQKLNKCTCSGADHPNPGVGRGAPEIDIIEAEVGTIATGNKVGVASQSLQLAPFDIWYYPNYDFVAVHNASVTTMNTYTGGPFQQAVSATTVLNTTWYEFGEGQNFQTYGFEYLNDVDNGYITWYVGTDPTMTLYLNSLRANGNVGDRTITKEPMSIVMNFGVSNNWAYIDWTQINFPCVFSVDYVRIYQPSGSVNVGCDPPDFPTYDYIQSHLPAYENVNHTSWKMAGYSFPKHKLTGCK